MARTVQTTGKSSDRKPGKQAEVKKATSKTIKPLKWIPKKAVIIKNEKKKAVVGNGNGYNKKEDGVVKKKRRFRPGTVALREIKRFQKHTNSLVQKMPMKRLIRDISEEQVNDMSKAYPGFRINNGDVRWSKKALDELSKASEMFLIKLFFKANDMCIHSKRMTIRPEDMMIALRSNSEDRMVYKNYLEKRGF